MDGDFGQSSSSVDEVAATNPSTLIDSVQQIHSGDTELQPCSHKIDQEQSITPTDEISTPVGAPPTTLAQSTQPNVAHNQSPTPEADETKRKSDIGPYGAKVSLSSEHFKQPVEFLPVIGTIKNGLVSELYEFLCVKEKQPLHHVTKVIIKLGNKCLEPSKVKNVGSYISQVYTRGKKLSRNLKVTVEKSVITLNNFKEEEFQFVRGKKHRKTTEDTPRKKRLREEVKAEKEHKKKVIKRLTLSEETVSELENQLSVSQGLHEMIVDEAAKRKKAEQHAEEAQEQAKWADEQAKKAQAGTRRAEENAEKAERTIRELEDELNIKMLQLEAMQAKFDPLQDDVAKYKEQCDLQQTQIEKVEAKCKAASKKLASSETRNVNKRLQRRDNRTKFLEKETEILPSLKEDLEDTKAKLQQTSQVCQTLKSKLDDTRKSRTSLVKVWYRENKIKKLSSSCYSEDDIQFYENRAEVLEVRVRELEDCISLCEDQTVTTFEEGKYTHTVRELIMELLSLNVSMSAVNKVIRSTLKKIANIEVGRLPSIGTTSKIVTEARVLADIEVGLAMKEARPEDVLGNVIHGDGTTKYHKKYQNWQTTLADKSTRTIGLTQMGSADTQAVVNSYKDRMQEIAAALETINDTGENKETLYKELMTSVKSTMTDQGPTMPQFSEKVAAIREEILPTIVSHWEDIPSEVQDTIKDFGTFYCKMHPLINCAEEVNKVLKSYEDIATRGKNAHTIITSEAGVTRLIRTSSKAFHHRGSDQSGVEDEFTEYIHRRYGESRNHLVHYIGNRANILFEGAATTLYHIQHMTSFVHAQPTPNQLLLAVCEDAEEPIHLAELRALAMTYKVITEPLWTAIKSCSSIFDLNSTLYSVQQKLNQWKDNPDGLMKGEQVIPDIEINQDELYDCAFVEEDNSEVHGMCVQALQLICCALLLIIERQCHDNLPGGKYWDLPTSKQQQFANVPSTNLIGERDFAILDMLVRQKPNARTINLEALVMWLNNGTVKWLETLDEATKKRYFEAARKHADSAVAHYNERMAKIKKERWEKIQDKQRSKEEKEKKAVEDRVKLTEDVVAQGGVWDVECINMKFEGMKAQMSNDQIRREIFKQLLFHQKVLKSKATKKEFFQLTATIDGKKHTFSKEEMKAHLEVIAEANRIVSTRDANEMAAISKPVLQPAVGYSSSMDLENNFERKKLEIGKKLEGERQKRAILNSKQYLDRLVATPHLLVGKRVKHKCYSPEGVVMWYPGMIESVVGEVNGEKTHFMIRYDEEYLAEEEPVAEEFKLLDDLKKNDLIIMGWI